MPFENIYGHESVIQRLMFTYQNDLIPSAYLFVGQIGIGKSTLIKEFGQVINCRTNNSCHECDNCRMFDNNSHPDFHVVKPNGQFIRIAQIHELIDKLSLKPTYARKRIVLVKDAFRLNQESANSFLKILEEPPLDTLIILTTTDENLLLETILSRCQRLFFSPLTMDQISSVIGKNYTLQPDEMEFVLNYSQGRIRKEFIEKADVLLNMRRQVLKLLLNLEVEFLVDYCLLLEQWVKKELHFFFLEFCSVWIRDLICLKNKDSVNLINQDMIEELQSIDTLFTIEQLQWCFGLVIETETAIRANASKNLALESLLIQLKQISEGTIVV